MGALSSGSSQRKRLAAAQTPSCRNLQLEKVGAKKARNNSRSLGLQKLGATDALNSGGFWPRGFSAAEARRRFGFALKKF